MKPTFVMSLALVFSFIFNNLALGQVTTPVRSDYALGEITQLCDQAVTDSASQFDTIGQLPAELRTTDNTLLALENASTSLNDITTPLIFMAYVHTDKKIVEEGYACEEKVSQFSIGLGTRKDLYLAIKDAVARTPEEARLLSETIKGFENNGLQLPDAQLAQVKALMQQLSGIETQFAANINKDTTEVAFTAEELVGVPESFLARLKKTADGQFLVTLKGTDYYQVGENAISSATRQKMMLAYLNKAADKNTALLEEALLVRQKIAAMLGYSTWADYRTNGRMAKNSATVLSFLTNLKDKLKSRVGKDFDQLLTFKKELDPSATKVNPWDINYLTYQLKKRDFTLDDELIRNYFPSAQVIQGMFEIYSQVLGLRFEQVTDTTVWSPDVQLYKIFDAKTNEAIAYFYTDFIPRPMKYGHAAAFTLLTEKRLADGSRSLPVSAIVANFNPPSGDAPSLMSHDEVETVFHEFGHIMHQTLTRAPYASLAGTAVARDFVESASQIMENWVWDAGMLNRISGHYQTGEKLPPALIEKMLAAKNFQQGRLTSGQLLYGLFDMTLHTTTGPVDATAVFNKLYQDTLGIDALEGGHFPASFGHLMNGYDAGYYGYLWSLVYATDMFTRFEQGGLLNPDVGVAYRRSILEQGNMAEPMDLLRQFLGREPDMGAFLRKLGIEE